jgi:hypothetical protein
MRLCLSVFAAGVQCITSEFGDKLRGMLSINQRFGKHISCHFQGEYAMGRVLEALYITGSVEY